MDCLLGGNAPDYVIIIAFSDIINLERLIIKSGGVKNMSLERAILLVVGLVVVGSLLLGIYQSPSWLWVTGLMGAHLIQASFTGMCPVVRLFQKLGLPQRAGFG